MHPLKEGDKLALSNVLFQPNTTVLRNSSKKELDKLVDYMNSHPARIRINGHTQGNRRVKNTGKGVGPEQRFKGSAWKLSWKRAKKVKAYLVSKGIEESRLNTRGYAGLKPVHRKPKNLSEREENMRVEIEILENKKGQ
jgi:outer membrane protein OmpA-like peptidoglycan-associated protein